MLKRAHKGTFHRLSLKHVHLYVDEFARCNNCRDLDPLEQMACVAAGIESSRLCYGDLVA